MDSVHERVATIHLFIHRLPMIVSGVQSIGNCIPNLCPLTIFSPSPSEAGENVGEGRTFLIIYSHHHPHPRDDEISYLSMKYISFFKGLSKMLILLRSTLKENSSLMTLLDELGLSHDLVFNKFDQVSQEKQEQSKQQIQSEVNSIGVTRVNQIYFISALQPAMFPDWLRMVQNLTA